ncbi:MAG: class I SAM-dependent methyltransferase [Ruminococcaceae bacterium]|nr:class I SAM-dependent methyltransferase [Oscillospiraceae bacterium]
MSDTKQYYQDNAQAFFDSTVNADMSAHYEHFLKYVPEHGRILDFGCGSGRDTKAFIQKGYLVDACDGSSEMCRLASELCNIQVKYMDFTDLNDVNKYDAIWACASLLHVAKTQLPAVLIKMRDALVNGGVMYISFKYGDYEGERNGRFFLDLTPEAFINLISL